MMKISVVLTTKNEEKNIGDLLESLMHQEEPYEVLVVDSDSTDETQEIVKKYSEKNKNIKLIIHPGTRAESMNYGIKQASGEAVAFIGGDDIADKDWIKEIRNAIKTSDIITGKLISKKDDRFGKVANVKLFHKGINVTYPGTNTTYKKEILDKLGGFDPWFFSAEDLEINLRAVNQGYKINYDERPKVYYRPRNNPLSFIRQSYMYGVGRRLLELKHGSILKNHSVTDMLQTQKTIWGYLRLIIGFIAYFFSVIKIRKYEINN
jgi:glycosyltransferase involved in cell wall biosynthesis